MVVRRNSFQFIYYYYFFNTAIVFEPLTQGVFEREKSIFIQEQLICI